MVSETSFPYLIWVIPVLTAVAVFVAIKRASFIGKTIASSAIAAFVYLVLEATVQGIGPLFVIGLVDIFIVYLTVCAVVTGFIVICQKLFQSK